MAKLAHDLSPLEQARLSAGVNLAFAEAELAKRLIDPVISTKALLDIAEHSYKVSGMAAQNAAKEAPSGQFIFTINLGDTTITARSEPIDVTPDSTSHDTVESLTAESLAFLQDTPTYVSASAGNLAQAATLPLDEDDA